MKILLLSLFIPSYTFLVWYMFCHIDLVDKIVAYVRTLSKEEDSIHYVDPATLPNVLIQIPIYKENMDTVAKTVESALAQKWPKEKLRIQILDDSPFKEAVYNFSFIRDRFKDHDVAYAIRHNRNGFKAGALQYGMNIPGFNSEYIAIFDADFTFREDWLLTVWNEFNIGYNVGCVQTRWTYRNARENFVTKAAQLLLDGHFLIEKTIRDKEGDFVGFNGSGGMWSKKCLIDAGGWSDDTLSEDTDLSYRAQNKGWQIRYNPKLICESELPTKLWPFLIQQRRWGKGVIEVGRKHLLPILKSPLPRFKKMTAFFNMFMWPMSYPVSMLMLLIAVGFLAIHAYYLAGWCLWLGIPFVSQLPYYLVATEKHHKNDVLLLPLIGFLMMFPLTVGVLEGLFGYKTEFVRTPKK